MLNYNESVSNLLKNMTQGHVDLWSAMNRQNKMTVDEFVTRFQDYNKEGLASLMTLFTIIPIRVDEVSTIKSEDTKGILLHKLMETRLRKAGLSDGKIKEQIVKSIASTMNIDKLLKEEIKKGAAQSALTLNEISDELFDKTALREAIIAEHDAINLYEQLAERTKDEKLKVLLLSIAKEEKVHVGELEAKLNMSDIKNSPAVNEGKQEAGDLMNKPVSTEREQVIVEIPKKISNGTT